MFDIKVYINYTFYYTNILIGGGIMTLKFNQDLCDGIPKYIDEEGLIIEQDGLLDFKGHEAYSSAQLLLDHFQYNIQQTNIFETSTGNNRQKTIEVLKRMKAAVEKTF